MNDVDFDYDAEGENSGEFLRAAERLKKLRDELGQCKKERQEYLDGWQRLKADIANRKKEETAIFIEAQEASKIALLEDLLPALDAFDMATLGENWKTVDTAWRNGIEYIKTQLLGALSKNGIEAFGETGEVFDPAKHEAIKETTNTAEKDGVISQVLRRGYMHNSKVLRPAHVVVNKIA